MTGFLGWETAVPDRVLTGHRQTLRGLARVHPPTGRVLLASASDEFTGRLWDPRSGEPVGGPLTGHSDQLVWVGPLHALGGVRLGLRVKSQSVEMDSGEWALVGGGAPPTALHDAGRPRHALCGGLRWWRTNRAAFAGPELP